MIYISTYQPTSEEILQKARDAGYIDSDTAEELATEDQDDVLGAIYGYILLKEHDPDRVFQEWGVT